MPSFSLRRRLVVLALAALLTLPSLALAAPWSTSTSRDAGMLIDPDGHTASQIPIGSASRDSGMLIDPNGVS